MPPDGPQKVCQLNQQLDVVDVYLALLLQKPVLDISLDKGQEIFPQMLGLVLVRSRVMYALAT